MPTNADLCVDYLVGVDMAKPGADRTVTNAILFEDYLVGQLSDSFLADLIREKGYYWDKKTGQYISRWTGKPVKETTVRRAVEKFNSKFIGENIDAITERFIAGQMDLQTWQVRIAKELKTGHTINAAVGRGGRSAMTFSDWGKVGRRLRDQYNYLNGFARAIKSGRLTPGQIRHRAGMYAKSVRSSYFGGLTAAKKVAGYAFEKRITTSEKPCGQCSAWESRGWLPIGTVPEPGTDCDGLTQCLCYKDFKK